MRVTKREGALSVRAIAGTHGVLMALDCVESKLAGLMGFAIKRQIGDVPGQDWLKGLKVFKSLDAAPKRGAEYSTFENPIQSFLWSDYTAQPDTQYTYTVAAMYGRPGALTQGDSITFTVKTERPDDGKHGIWFNRGAIAGQAFAREFDNARLTDAVANNPKDRMTAWLSRGLLESCLDLVANARPREALRVVAQEITYPPLLAALKTALADGVDVQIVYHKTPENETAFETAGIAAEEGGKRILHGRWHTRIPRNRFIVKLDAKGEPISVWTGSTNFTASGFLGQTNVAHLVTDSATTRAYLGLWQALADDPGAAATRERAIALTPNPPNAPAKGVTALFSPRASDRMLDWFTQRIGEAKTSVMFSASYGVSAKIVAALEKRAAAVRFALLEKPPDADLSTAEPEQRDTLLLSYGEALGYESKSTPQGGRTFVPIARYSVDDWFLKEELLRASRHGFLFYVHAKFLLVDPLADDPLVCTGSGNFSDASLLESDENTLLIRGDTRIADIYVSEFDRLFRQFHFREVAEDLAMRGRDSTAIFLDETGSWVKSHFESGTLDNARRQLFFADSKKSWAQQAASEANLFAGEKPAPLPAEPKEPPKRVIPLKPVPKDPPKPPAPPPPKIVPKIMPPPVAAKPLPRPLVPPPMTSRLGAAPIKPPVPPAPPKSASGAPSMPPGKVPPKPPAPPPKATEKAVALKPGAAKPVMKPGEKPAAAPKAPLAAPAAKPPIAAKPGTKLPAAAVKPAPALAAKHAAAPAAVKPATAPAKALAKPTAAKSPAKSVQPAKNAAKPVAKPAAKAAKPVAKPAGKRPAVKTGRAAPKPAAKRSAAKPAKRVAAAKQKQAARKAKKPAKPVRKPAGKPAKRPAKPAARGKKAAAKSKQTKRARR